MQTSTPSRGRKCGVFRAKGDNGGEGTCFEQLIHFTPLWNILLGARRTIVLRSERLVFRDCVASTGQQGVSGLGTAAAVL